MSLLYSRLNPSEHRLETPVAISFGVTDLDVGGAEKALVQLATRLDRSFWRPSVVCLQPEGPLAEPLRKAHVDVTSLNVRSWRNVAPALRQWRRNLIDRSAAVLQTFLFHANALGKIAGRMARVPAIVSGVRVAERRSNAHILAEMLTHRLSHSHVCVSRGVAEFQTSAAHVPRSKIAVIPNGVDVDAVEPTPVDWSALQLPAATAKLVVVGRLDPQKGIGDFFEALAPLPREKRPSVALVGAGNEREALEEQAKRLQIGDSVRFVGWRPNPHDWMAAADALVLPSRWEGMPNVVLEAMALGKPALAANVEGVGELVEDGRTGWLAEAGNPASIVAALNRFLEDRHRWTEMGVAARKKAREEFSIDVMVERYERLWLELIERHRRRIRPVSHDVVANYAK